MTHPWYVTMRNSLFILCFSLIQPILAKNQPIKQIPLYKKLESFLPQNALKQQEVESEEGAASQTAQKELKAYLAQENKKYCWLYNEVVADATVREKAEKAAVLIATLILAYKNYLAFLKDPAQAGAEQVPHALSKYLYRMINAILYLLFYEYMVTKDKMSRPLAGLTYAVLSSQPFDNAQFHGLMIFWALHHIFLKTTTDKLSAFLDCDADTWLKLKKQIPHELLKEFDDLRNNFLKYKTILLEPSEQEQLIKKISLGRYIR